MNDATSGRQGIKRHASGTHSYESDEPLQTNQRMKDATSEPPLTSLGLEEGKSGSVHSIQFGKVDTKRGIFAVEIATAEVHEQFALK